MRDRHLPLNALAAALGLASFFAVSTIAQAPTPGAKPAAPAAAKPATGKPTGAVAAAAIKTPWGAPDLEGTWFVIDDVPLERSAANAGKEFLTDEEVAAANKRKAEAQGRNTRAGSGTAQDVEGAYNAVFNSILKTGKRTSRVIDPPDGCIPATVTGAGGGGRGGGGGFGGGGGGCVRDGAAPPAGDTGRQGRGAAGVAPRGGGAAPGGAPAARGGAPGAGGAPPAAAPGAAGAAPGAQAAAGGGGARGGGGGRGGGNDNPEQIAQNPRCLGVTLPFLPLNTQFAQGTVMRIVQSPKSLAIYMEDDHAGGGNRVVYMDGAHPPASMKLYLGDSRGRWDGNTLVVETTNFSSGFRGSNVDSYKMIERYTRTATNDLRRDITFDDPKTWTRPWTVRIDMGKVSDKNHMIFESACHEGNYGMTGILVGARLEERAAAAKK